MKSLILKKRALQKQIKTARQRELDEATMAPAEYRRFVEVEFGMNLAQGGVLFGVSTRTSQRWALAELPVPTSVAHLLRLMKRTGTRPEQLDRSIKSVAEAA